MATTLEMIHEDLEVLKREIAEIKKAIFLEPELREEIIAKVQEARKRMKNEYVTHEEVMSEFASELPSATPRIFVRFAHEYGVE